MTRSLKKYFAFIPAETIFINLFLPFHPSTEIFAMIRKKKVCFGCRFFFISLAGRLPREAVKKNARREGGKSVESFRNHRNLLFVNESAGFSFEQTNIKICFCRYFYFHGNDFSVSRCCPKEKTPPAEREKRKRKKKVTDRIPGKSSSGMRRALFIVVQSWASGGESFRLLSACAIRVRG